MNDDNELGEGDVLATLRKMTALRGKLREEMLLDLAREGRARVSKLELETVWRGGLIAAWRYKVWVWGERGRVVYELENVPGAPVTRDGVALPTPTIH